MNDTYKTLSMNKRIILTGAFSALEIVLTLTNLGFITVGPTASITILQIPVILVAMLCGLPSGVFVGAVFGIMSLIKAAMSPSGGLDPFFVNPLCSVLPRMLLGVAAWGFWKLFQFLPKTVNAAISAFLATIFHTIFVIGALYLFNGSGVKAVMDGTGYFAVLLLLTPQAVMEAVSSAIVCVAVFLGLFIAGSKKSKLSTEEDEEEIESL